ncbi:protein-tyrosine phosphatase-like protein, partial [Baffinella frigidus]
GFDLDLTYITPRVIAMGYPATGFEGHFRNSADEVYRFFEERHSGHYRIINLLASGCGEGGTRHGCGVVARYPFCDHNPPAMELLLPACAHMHAYLQLSPDNTVAVHCKAGKGRTGLIIVCYLLFAGLVRTTRTARRWYDTSRAKDCKGLTIISQIRYAHYFEEQLRRLQSGQDCPTVQSASPALRLIGPPPPRPRRRPPPPPPRPPSSPFTRATTLFCSRRVSRQLPVDAKQVFNVSNATPRSPCAQLGGGGAGEGRGEGRCIA